MLALAGAGFVLAWSTGFWFAKVDAGAPVVTVLAWRFLLVAVVAIAVVAVLRRRDVRRRSGSGSASTSASASASGAGPGSRAGPGIHALVHQAGVGLLSQAGYVLPVYAAVGLGIATGTSALVDGIQPVLVAALAGPLLGLTVHRSQWWGLAVAVVGVGVLVLLDLGRGTAPGWAYLLLLASVVSLVAGTFLERRSRTPRLPLTTMLAVHLSVSALVLVALAVVRGELAPSGDPWFWAVVVGLAIGPTLGGYGLYWYLLRRIDVTALNALLFLVVPTTTAGGALMFGEQVGPAVLVGMAITAAGVALVLRGERRRPDPTPADLPRERAPAVG